MEIPTVLVKTHKFACETCMTLHDTEQRALDCCELKEAADQTVFRPNEHEVSPEQELVLTSDDSPPMQISGPRKTKWSRDLFSLFLDEVELKYSSLRDRSSKKISIWKEICAALNVHNPDLTYDQVHQKWRNIVATVRKYEESLQQGERGRKVRPLFYERIKIILGESEPNYLEHDISSQGETYPKDPRGEEMMSQSKKRKMQLANVIETLAQVWNSEDGQNYDEEGLDDTDSEDGEVFNKKSRYNYGSSPGMNVKLYDIPPEKRSNSNPNTGVYVYDFKSDWHNKLPFIQRGPTMHQFWCDICKVLDFCDYKGHDGIRWHIQSASHREKEKAKESAAHQEKAKESVSHQEKPKEQKVPKSTTKSSGSGKSVSQVEPKVIDIKKLEKMVTAKTEIVNRAIIISVDIKTQPRPDAEMVKDILSVVGENNIEEIDMVTKTLFLLTLKKGCETLLDSIRMIKYYDVFEMVEIHYTLHFLHMIEAKIEGILTGLPRLISSSELPCIKDHIGKYMSHLSDIAMEYVPWPGTSLMSGNLKVTASVKDLAATYIDIKKPSYIFMADFMGKLNFESFVVTSERKSISVPFEERQGISIHNW